MRTKAKEVLSKAAKTISYGEIDLKKMDELRTHCADKLISESGVVV